MSTKLMVVGQLPPPHHGSTVMTDIFCQTLKKLGFRVLIFEKKFSKKMEQVENFAISKIIKIPVVIYNIILKVIVNKPKICFFLASVKPPSLYFDLLLLVIIKLLGCNVVLYLHGKGYEKIFQKKGFLVRLFFHKIFSSCLGAIVLGKALKKDICRYISDDRIFVLPNCVPDSNFQKNYIKIDINEKNDKNMIQVLYLSNLVPTKGALEFLKMAKQVIKSCQDVRFILAGGKSTDHKFFDELNKYIEKNKLKKYVNRVGAVYGVEKEKIFQKSDIFVFPTYYELETFGLVNIEAMRAGLPVISSNEGCIPEIVQDGVNGFIVNPKCPRQIAEKILTLIKNRDLRKKMGIESRKIFESNYNLDIYRNNLDSAIKFFMNKIKFSKA